MKTSWTLASLALITFSGCVYDAQPSSSSEPAPAAARSLDTALTLGRIPAPAGAPTTRTVAATQGAIQSLSAELAADKGSDARLTHRASAEEEGARQLSLSEGIEISPGFELSLSLAKSDYVVGEPIWVRATLTNVSDQPLEIAPQIDPRFTWGKVLFTTPSGEALGLSPLTQLCSRGDLLVETFAPGQRHVEDFPVFFGRDGFLLDEPGTYGLQVLYRGITEDGGRIDSDVAWITVHEGGLTDLEAAREMGLLMMWGEGDHLTKGMADLTALAQGEGDTDLGAAARFTLGRSASVEFTNGVTHQVRAPQPREALAWLAPLMDDLERGGVTLPEHQVRDTYLLAARAHRALGRADEALHALDRWARAFGPEADEADVALIRADRLAR